MSLDPYQNGQLQLSRPNGVATVSQLDDEEAVRRSHASGRSGGVPTEDDDDGYYTDTSGKWCCAPLDKLTKPVEVGELGSPGYAGKAAFWIWPVFGPLLIENTNSDVRDGLANERTFLAYFRLSMTMSLVAVTIVVSFHLKDKPTDLELRMSRPLGIVFWLLAVSMLGLGLSNYINTLNKYSRRQAIVQTGWKTQTILATVACCILGTCITLLIVNKRD